MAANNVLANLIRAFVTKSPELEADALARAASNPDSKNEGGPLKLLMMLLAAAADTKRPTDNPALMSTDELRAIQTGMTSSTESQRADATVTLTTRD